MRRAEVFRENGDMVSETQLLSAWCLVLGAWCCFLRCDREYWIVEELKSCRVENCKIGISEKAVYQIQYIVS